MEKEYTVLVDVTINEVPYAAGQTQIFSDEVAAPFVESGALAATAAPGAPEAGAPEDEVAE